MPKFFLVSLAVSALLHALVFLPGRARVVRRKPHGRVLALELVERPDPGAVPAPAVRPAASRPAAYMPPPPGSSAEAATPSSGEGAVPEAVARVPADAAGAAAPRVKERPPVALANLDAPAIRRVLTTIDVIVRARRPSAEPFLEVRDRASAVCRLCERDDLPPDYRLMGGVLRGDAESLGIIRRANDIFHLAADARDLIYLSLIPNACAEDLDGKLLAALARHGIPSFDRVERGIGHFALREGEGPPEVILDAIVLRSGERIDLVEDSDHAR